MPQNPKYIEEKLKEWDVFTEKLHDADGVLKPRMRDWIKNFGEQALEYGFTQGQESQRMSDEIQNSKVH